MNNKVAFMMSGERSGARCNMYRKHLVFAFLCHIQATPDITSIPCEWVAVIEAICEERKTVRILKTKSQTVINSFSDASV